MPDVNTALSPRATGINRNMDVQKKVQLKTVRGVVIKIIHSNGFVADARFELHAVKSKPWFWIL